MRVVPARTDEQKQALAKLITYIIKNNLKPSDYLISEQFKDGVKKEIKRLQNWIYGHRSKFVLLDRALEVRDGKKSRSKKITWHGMRH